MKKIFFMTMIFSSLSAHALIIGGKPFDKYNTFENALSRAVVSLMDGNHSFCTGTLISDDVVITAAHCRPTKKNQIGVYNIHERQFVKYEILSIRIHEGFGFRELDANDIALINLKTKVLDFDAIVELPSKNLKLTKLDSVMVAGYGKPYVGQLTHTYLELDNLNFSLSEFSLVHSKSKGICHGDSGGPAFLIKNGRATVVGIVSHFTSPSGGSSTCEENSVYTKVSHFLGWISANEQFK
jgi:secreted trypsin-like serine protease